MRAPERGRIVGDIAVAVTGLAASTVGSLTVGSVGTVGFISTLRAVSNGVVGAVGVPALAIVSVAAFVVAGVCLSTLSNDVGERGGRPEGGGFLRKIVRWCGAHRRAAGRHREGSAAGWPIRVAAALMPATTRERWLEDVAVSLYDYPPEEHRALVRDFLAHAPAVVAAAWLAELPRRALGGERPPERSR